MTAEITQFLYKLEVIKERFYELKKAIPNGRIYYSLKANANATVLKFINELGLHAEVSSPGELDIALTAGFNQSLIVYGGPGKTINSLLYAVNKGVRYFSLESITELNRLATVQVKTGYDLKRIIRLLIVNNSGLLNMMMPNSKFGITLAELSDYIAKNDEFIYGIHIYNGTQVKESDFRESIVKTNELISEVELILGYKLRYINYGGGLAWPFMKSGSLPISLDKISGVMSNIESCFEFGRYLVASCGTLETEVLDVKIRNGQQIVIVSAGLNSINGISASGRLIRHNPDFYVNKGRDSNELLNSAVYGPLCTPADYLTLNTLLPRLEPGDILSIPNCGAYSFNTGLTKFLLREPTKELIIG